MFSLGTFTKVQTFSSKHGIEHLCRGYFLFWVSTPRKKLSFPVTPGKSQEIPRVALGNVHAVGSGWMTAHFPYLFFLSYILPSLGMKWSFGIFSSFSLLVVVQFPLFLDFSRSRSNVLSSMKLSLSSYFEGIPPSSEQWEQFTFLPCGYLSTFHHLCLTVGFLELGSMSEPITMPYTLYTFNIYLLS